MAIEKRFHRFGRRLAWSADMVPMTYCLFLTPYSLFNRTGLPRYITCGPARKLASQLPDRNPQTQGACAPLNWVFRSPHPCALLASHAATGVGVVRASVTVVGGEA